MSELPIIYKYPVLSLAYNIPLVVQYPSDTHFQRYGGGGVTTKNTEEQLIVFRLRFSKM